MRRYLIALVALATLAIWAPLPSSAQEVLNKPIYNSETKSYFELAGIEADAGGHNWKVAKAKAEQRVFKGVRGRLAIVPSNSVNEFLKTTFRPNVATFIGLRYFCEVNRSVWIDGRVLNRSEYQNWGRLWNTEGGSAKNTIAAGCGRYGSSASEQYLPVHYWGIPEGFYWNANGTPKFFTRYFVEYVTNGE